MQVGVSCVLVRRVRYRRSDQDILGEAIRIGRNDNAVNSGLENVVRPSHQQIAYIDEHCAVVGGGGANKWTKMGKISNVPVSGMGRAGNHSPDFFSTSRPPMSSWNSRVMVP
jgi:hypothetical protein